MKIIIIENLEEVPGRWIAEEYAEAHRVARERGHKLIVSGRIPEALEAMIRREGVEIGDGRAYNRPDAILLDLWAPRRLEPWEAQAANAFIVGGILGDHPPRGRTALIYDLYPYAARRNLGREQLSVDGAVKVLLEVLSGKSLDEIELVVRPTFKVRTLMEIEITLPFAYPLKDGKVWISEKLLRMLERGLTWEEAVAMSP